MIGDRLEAARSKVEQRFLEGGNVLLSVMEVLNRLLASLDNISRALETGSANDTMAGLLATVKNLSELPEIESLRQTNLEALAIAGSGMRNHVDDMQETMRYLQTFAVTVKITGAGLPEFAGFAEEILDRIRSGTSEVKGFAEQLIALEKDLTVARSFGATISKQYAQTVPDVVRALETDARTITEHRAKLGVIAREVGVLARGIQSKVATTLSALQIGDITRQRIEHVQATLSMLDTCLAGEEARALSRHDRERLTNIIHHLCAAQMVEMVEDFQRDSRNVVQTIASFGGDTQEILNLRAQMQGNGGDDNFMRALEESVTKALGIVAQVEAASLKADAVSQSTAATASRLLEGIDNIRSIKMDIHYMALNTNLRCSRLGEAGRSINVVTGELRLFAGKLDESADAIVTGLTQLDKAAEAMNATANSGSRGLEERLNGAVSNIRTTANAMEDELATLSEHGREVATQISLMIAKLDFQHDLGEILSASSDELLTIAGADIASSEGLEAVLAPLSQRVFKTYTMVQERNVHHAVIPPLEGFEAPAATPAPAAQDDDDLFADALF
ncbi:MULTISPECIES: chemotaxis protein [unclassified Rhizobium]|uniref:chemotaxis protein n=1 Tax=unclassified Rhizobium TaxID=2613769 RepID=UPI001FCD4E7C|nr:MULTISPECIES: chemotaxis protein [unclassified Rhizobium]